MKKTLLLAALSIISSAYGYEAKITRGQMAPKLDVLLQKATQDTGVHFSLNDFTLIEQRELATSNYKFYVQTNQMVPVAGTAVRVWTDKKSGELIYGAMHLDEKSQKNKSLLASRYLKGKFSLSAMKSTQLKSAIDKIATESVSKHSTDNRVLGIKSKDQWQNGDLVRVTEVRGRRGIHTITVSLLKNKVISKFYTEFPQSEAFHTIKANIFPMYEEVEGTGQRLSYEVKELKYISKNVTDGGENPLSVLGSTNYLEKRYHPILAETEIGQLYKYWSQASLRRDVEKALAKHPNRTNDFSSGLLLQGKYATINLHPGIKEAFKDFEFDLTNGHNHLLGWNQTQEGWEAVPVSGLYGRPITSEADALSRIPVRHPEHNTIDYINSGVDELQVYWSVTVLMEALAEMGFTDPELSTRPFHAFLFDPDIGMRDNAYYTDDTINFTTYNPGSPNLARDNPTIWHELGHGIMDRLMGAHLGFAGAPGGYGGLSEGMADFLAHLVVEHQTNGDNFPGKEDFRINNETGFYLTNEFHDEGEAYGGAMKDMLSVIISNEGREGLVAFTDLTLEAMRLTRNHPALTAAGWFEHMILADELGSSVRASGKYQEIISNTLTSRNFSFSSGFQAAEMNVKFDNTELTATSPGSRENALTPCDTSGVVSYDLKLSLTAGDADFITYPATVKVEYKKGALQGAIKWIGEESNPHVYTVNSADEILTVPVQASMSCDYVNQPDGSCKDYAYLQVFNEGSAKPVAKKRFYLKIQDKASCK